MRAVLLFGFLMGMRHALEADHIAAVASLATRSRGARATAVQGAVWGLGHTLTLLVVGGLCLLLNSLISEKMGQTLELIVGFMLLLLGAEVFWRMRRQRVHVHVHRHSDGAEHLHAHSHLPGHPHDPIRHEHPHAKGFPRRALLVGIVHGLAGSAALMLVTLPTAPTPWIALAYIGLFGLGSILGMAALSVVIAVPLQLSARRLASLHNGLEALIGLTAVGVGVEVLYGLGFLQRLLR